MSYKRLAGDEHERRNAAQLIIDTYLGEQAIMQVNVSNRLVQDVNDIVLTRQVSVELFDAIILELESKLLADSYTRFRHTDRFKMLKLKHGVS